MGLNPVVNAMKVLHPWINESVNAGVFCISLVAASIV